MEDRCKIVNFPLISNVVYLDVSGLFRSIPVSEIPGGEGGAGLAITNPVTQFET